MGPGQPEVGRQVLELEYIALAFDPSELKHVLQLTDVARPGEGRENVDHFVRDRDLAAAGGRRRPHQEVLCEQRNIGGPLPKRWQAHRNDAQAVEQVLSKPPRPNLPLEVLVGRAQHPRIDRSRRVAANWLEGPCLQDPQELDLG